MMRWSAYERVFGPIDLASRTEYAAAIIALTVASTVPREKGSQPLTVSDFLVDWDPHPKKPASGEEMRAKMLEVFGG